MEHDFVKDFELPVREQQFLSCFLLLQPGNTPLTAAVKTGNIEMCSFLLEKEADINLGGSVSTTMWLVCRWMWWGRDIVVVCVCVCVCVFM